MNPALTCHVTERDLECPTPNIVKAPYEPCSQSTRTCGIVGASRAHGDGQRRWTHAIRIERAEAPSGSDRQRGGNRADHDRRNRGLGLEATSEARERLGGFEGPSGRHNARTAVRDRAGCCQRTVGVMNKIVRTITKGYAKDHGAGKGLKPGRFLDYVLEMYSPPSAIVFRSVPNGREGIAQDRARIRGYFRAAQEKALESAKK